MALEILSFLRQMPTFDQNVGVVSLSQGFPLLLGEIVFGCFASLMFCLLGAHVVLFLDLLNPAVSPAQGNLVMRVLVVVCLGLFPDRGLVATFLISTE
jgi:hypothetical protein